MNVFATQEDKEVFNRQLYSDANFVHITSHGDPVQPAKTKAADTSFPCAARERSAGCAASLVK